MVSPVLTSPSFTQQDTFVHALSKSTFSHTLFSSTEKRILAALCVGVFTLPILTSFVLLRTSGKQQAFTTPSTPVALLNQPAGITPGTSDELAMASYFMDKAGSTSGAESANLLSEAQALLTATTQTGEKVDTLKTQLASLLGTPGVSPNTGSPQRVAAAPAISGALSTSTSSNATGKTLMMVAGTSTLSVADPQLSEGTQIYLTIENNRDNSILYVKGKKAGSGFTLASTAPLQHDVTVTWYEIASP